jgi:sugar transferase (PEP-CTERM/EpsH1 system associated)
MPERTGGSHFMHILWMKTELLHPLDKGGRIRTHRMLRQLRRQHQITYLCLDDGTSGHAAHAAADDYCERLVALPTPAIAKGTLKFYDLVARSVVEPLPYAIARYRSAAMQQRAEELARQVDLVVCDFLVSSVNLPERVPVPTILFQHNVEAAIWRRRAQVAGNLLVRAYLTTQWWKMVRYERAQCQRFDHVVVVSPDDAETHRREYDAVQVTAVPTGVDLDYFKPDGVEPRSGEIVFVGSMDWSPNEDAAVEFATRILPRVRQRVPSARFNIVGRAPPPRVRALARADGSVRVTGRVDDVRPFYETASVVVVPLRVGGGTRLKIFEAMAMERPVVSTTIGAEGLPVHSGEDIVLADDEAAFAHRVADLLLDPARAAALGRRGGATVRPALGWERAAEAFGAICGATLARRKEPSCPT